LSDNGILSGSNSVARTVGRRHRTGSTARGVVPGSVNLPQSGASSVPQVLLAQEDRRQADDVLHIHVAVSVGVKKLPEDWICLASGLRACLAGRRFRCSGWPAGLKEADYRRKDDRQETENGAGVESCLLLSASDHLVHSIRAKDLPEPVGRISALFDFVEERINALRARERLLLSKHRLQKAANQACDLICRGTATLERGRQGFKITHLGCAGGVVQRGENSVEEAHVWGFLLRPGNQ
jgi:hypothetical protein